MLYRLLLGVLVAVVVSAIRPPSAATVTIKNNHPLIFYHGRWDSSPGTWWTGSGFKLNVENLQSLALNLGLHTTSPFAAIGVSINNAPFFTVNASAGITPIPLPPVSSAARGSTTLVRINVEGSVSNRINLESITLNANAVLHPYKPSKLVFQFIGDSFSSGYLLPMGVDQAWTFIVGERYGAEHRINAAPGAALTDVPSYGNVHGISYQYFKVEDTNYYYTTDHNYTTPWNFARDQPPATHVVIHIGANDSAQNVTASQFVQVYTDFLARIRKLYPHQPIFMLTPWGWPTSDGNVYYYYQGQYQEVLNARTTLGDKNIFLVDATGWVSYEDVFPDSLHPTVDGQVKIANEFTAWMENWGLSPNASINA
ncbi:hypothetical protein BDN70DRAFT_904789 [Pholiota conissans]|uniref:SGNH hydrolase-type esterase domain-containing protein n=1 Tax=Pholiota conissans TaxID=109636 RepID=A0A9P5Z7Z6_9AGAR|nr:hypothetical protein BDN70DRAFT_904789 [Pholiota conissans]